MIQKVKRCLKILSKTSGPVGQPWYVPKPLRKTCFKVTSGGSARPYHKGSVLKSVMKYLKRTLPLLLISFQKLHHLGIADTIWTFPC